MKIAGTNPVRNNGISRRKAPTESSRANFASELSQPAAPGGAAPARAAGVIDGILALQEVDEDGRGKGAHIARGEEMLDRLDEIRAGLLSGRLNPTALERLLDQVRNRSQTVSDPGLREILEEIELRAAVELAKLGRAA